MQTFFTQPKMSSPSTPTTSHPGFTTLSRGVSVSLPTDDHRSQTAASAQPPQIIVLLSWMGGSPRNIAKYLARYRTAYPSATIFHIATTLTDACIGPIFPRDLSLVVDALATAPPNTPILVHLFSSSGAYSLHQLLLAFRARTGHALPATALILDSSPGHATFMGAVRGMRVGLKPVPFPMREIMLLVLTILLAVHRLGQILGMGDTVARARNALKDKALISVRAIRLYLYSKADELVPWEHVEDHANEAQETGCVVRRVVFEDTHHVAHAVVHGEKYWRAVDELWAEAVKGQL